MIRRTGKLLFILIIILSSADAYCGDISVSADISHDTVGIDDTFIYSIKIESADQDADPDVNPPSFDRFELISTSRSSSISIINNSVTRGTIHNFVLKPKETGILTIGAGEALYKSKSYRTKPLKVTVKEGSIVSQSSRRRSSPFMNPDPFDSFFDMDRNLRRRDQISREDAFVELSVSNENPYIYEQVVLTVLFYKKPDLMGEASLNPFQIPDVWMEELDQDAYQDMGYTYRDNQRYSLHKIYFVFYPTKSGELVLPKARITVSPVSFFSSNPITFESDAKTLMVKPLPTESIIPVGKFKLERSMEAKQDYYQSQPVVMKVRAEGKGRLRESDIMIDNRDDRFEIYPPKISSEKRFTENRLDSITEMEYIIIPGESGKLTVPGVSLKYFDPERKRVETDIAEEITLDFKPAKKGEFTENQKYNEVRNAKSDILYLMQYSHNDSTPFSLRFPEIILYSLAVLSFLSVITGVYRDRQSYSKIQRIRRSSQRARRMLRKVDPCNKPKESAKELVQILNYYLSKRFDITANSLTKTELIGELRENSADETAVEMITAVLELLNSIAYNPAGNADQSLDEVKKDILQIIKRTET